MRTISARTLSRMAILSSIFFCVALVLSITIGPQTRPWTWGPSLIFLGLSTLSALAVLYRSRPQVGATLLVFGAVTAGWFAWRASISPVAELRTADLLLLAGTVGSFVVVVATAGNRTAERIFLWTLSGLLVASVAVIIRQIIDPAFHPIFASKPVTLPSGFFGHYNECANFLIGAGFLLGAAALFGSHSKTNRIVWGLTAVVGLAAVYYTRSRGGILAVGGGMVIFWIVSLLMGKRRRSPIFSFGIIALPILLFVAAGFIYKGWSDAQSYRFQTTGLVATDSPSVITDAASVLESSIRLHLFGIAFSCINLHPWSGGGSRSFSWECNQFWNSADHGAGASKLEFVHNELLQSATDYGLVGALLLATLLSCITIGVIVRSSSGKGEHDGHHLDAFHLGGIAGLAGMFVQSNFSFVFHLLPGVLLLGICLGRMAVRSDVMGQTAGWIFVNRGILAASGIAIGISCLWMGGSGSRVLGTLWISYFSAPALSSTESKAEALADAIAVWPQATLHDDRAYALQMISKESGLPPQSDPYLQQAIVDYRAAIQLHPYEPNVRTNLAGILGILGKNEVAEEQYRRAGELAGGLEAAYRSHFKFCQYLIARGMTELETNQIDAASRSFGDAQQQFETIKQKTPWIPEDQSGLDLMLSLYTGIGMSNEAAGDFAAALENFDEVSKHFGGGIGHYHAGLLLGKMAETAWKERQPSRALTLFNRSRQRLEAPGEIPPELRKKRTEYLAFVTQRIQYLQAAKIIPLPEDE